MFGSWIWSTYIVITKTVGTSALEKTVLIVGASAILLYIIGTV